MKESEMRAWIAHEFHAEKGAQDKLIAKMIEAGMPWDAESKPESDEEQDDFIEIVKLREVAGSHVLSIPKSIQHAANLVPGRPYILHVKDGRLTLRRLIVVS